MEIYRAGIDRSAPAPAVVASDFDGLAKIVTWLRACRDHADDPTRLDQVRQQVPLLSAVRLRKDIDAWARVTGRCP